MKRLCCLLLLFLLPIFASAEEFFLEVPDIKGFSLNEITVHSPDPGQLTLSVVAGTNTFFTWTADVSRGENTIEWNGLGYHNEVIPEGTYRMSVSLESDNQQEQTLTTETLFSVTKCKNALLFALPKSDTIYFDGGNRWACEMQLARSGGTIVTEYYRFDDLSQMLGTKQNQVKSGTLIDYVWDGKINDKKTAPGVYLLRFYEKSTPDYVHEALVTIAEGKPPKAAVEVTGPIMPTADMSDDEIWALIDTVGNVPVIYSLGNLMFGGTIEMSTFDGMLAQLRLRFDENGYVGCGIELIPVLTSSKANEGINDYCPVIAEGEDCERILEKVQADTPFPLMEQMFFYRNPTNAQSIDK